MANNNEESRIKIIIDGGMANASLKEMEAAAKAARKAISEMAANDPKRKQLIEDYQKITDEIKKQKAEINGTTKEVMGLAGSMSSSVKEAYALFDTIKSGIGTAVNAFSTLKGAIAATGIGLLVIAFTTLVAWFKKTDDGAMILEGIMRAIGAVVDVLFKKLMDIGQALFKFFTDPKKALSDLITFIEGNLLNRLKAFMVIWEGITNLDLKKTIDGVVQLGTGVENATDKAAALVEEAKKIGAELAAAAKEGMALAKLFDDLDDKRREMELTASELDKQVYQYLKQSQNVQLSIEERLELLDKASSIETEQMQTKLAYQNQLIAAIQRENNLKEQSGTLLDEDKDKLNNAMITRNQMELSSIQLQEKIANRRSILILAQQKEEKEAIGIIDKLRSDALKKELEEADRIGKLNLDAAKVRKHEEGLSDEWLARRQKEITLGVAQFKLDIAKKFAEDELAYEAEVAAAKDNLTKEEAQKLADRLKKESDTWFNYYNSQLEIAAKHATDEQALLDIRLEQIELAAEKERAIAGDNAVELLRIEAEKNEKIDDLKRTASVKEDQNFDRATSSTVSFGNNINNIVTAQENNALAKQRARNDIEKATLKKKLDEKKITQEEYNKAIVDLDEKMHAEEVESARRAAIRQKFMAVMQIVFDTSTAIMKSVAASPLTFGMPWTAIIAGMGALQTGAVLSQDPPAYFDGGFLPKSTNDRDAIPIIGHANEYMVNAEATRDPLVMNTIGLIEAGRKQGKKPSELVSGSSNTAGGSDNGMYQSALAISNAAHDIAAAANTMSNVIAAGIRANLVFDERDLLEIEKINKRLMERGENAIGSSVIADAKVSKDGLKSKSREGLL